MLRRKSGDQAKKPKPKKEKKPKAKKPKPSGKAQAKPKGPGVVVQKRPTDVYTVMLMISLAAVLLACLMLWLELSSYGSFPQWSA